MEGRADLEIALLGGFRVTVLGHAVEDGRWRLRKARSLVKLLALTDGHQLARERVMDLLWPDLDPAAADNNLRQTLHVARRALDPDPASRERWLSVRGDHLALGPGRSVHVDAVAFSTAVARARASRQIRALEEAIALYTGELLPEDPFEDWVVARREGLRETHLAALMELARGHADAGREPEAIRVLERAVAVAPSLEEAHTGLMRLFARAGDRRRALQQFDALTRALRDELDAEPEPASVRLRDDIVAGRLGAGVRSHAATRPHNLPAQLTTFVGRAAEQEAIVARLSTDRLLTLTGPGGSGKTRLAIAAAEEVLRRGDAVSVAFVDLAPIADASLVPDTVAATLADSASFQSLDGALTRLGAEHALVVLDSCEHVVGGAAGVARLILDRCPNARVLATSRQSLGVVGERIVDVPPLGVPGATGDPREAEAVQLFVDRVRLARPTFALGDRNTLAVAEICRRLDGLPLAIELAAAQLRVLSLDELVRRIDDRFRVLVGGGTDRPPRHQTLRAAIDWSYEQLPAPAQLVFERLAVFRGPWDLAWAEAVVVDDDVTAADVPALIGSLVDHSLLAVQARDDGSVRYRMLDTVRDYARGRLAEHAGHERAALRHADHFIAYVEQGRTAVRDGRSADQRTWLRLLYEAGEELRSAFQTILARRDRERAMRFGAAMVTYYVAVGSVVEGTRLLEDALALDDGEPTLLRARLLAALGSVRRDLGERQGARRAYEEAIGIARALGDRQLLASLLSTLGGMLVPERAPEARGLLEEALAGYAALPEDLSYPILLWNLANHHRSLNERERARALYEDALAAAQRVGAVREGAMIRHSLGTLAQADGDLAGARRHYTESLTTARELDDWWLLILVLSSLARLELREGRADMARSLRREALEKAQARQERELIATLVEDTGLAAIGDGKADLGLRLLAAGNEWHRQHGLTIAPFRTEAVEGGRGAAELGLGAAAAARAEAEGRRLTLDRAVATILGDPSL